MLAFLAGGEGIHLRVEILLHLNVLGFDEFVERALYVLLRHGVGGHQDGCDGQGQESFHI